MHTIDTVRICASDHIDPTRPVVESAELIAKAVAAHLGAGANVVLSVAGVRGTSTSFFNVILAMVGDVLKGAFASGRFRVETDTPTQKMVFDRSWKARAKALGLT